MNTISKQNSCFWRLTVVPTRAFVVAGFLLCIMSTLAQPGPGEPANYLDSWSFYLIKGWPSDQGYFPLSYDNLAFSNLGNGSSLVVDTNAPAWLQYNVVENDGTTNLAVADGTVTFWFAPGSWSSTNGGPGQCAQLIDVGELTTNAASGYWGLLVDASGQNLWFISQDGAGNSYSLSTPISWTTDYFHFIALTYSPTNVSLYLDGQLATNDPGGLSVLPGPAVLANGFFIGSDTNGFYRAQGLFNSVFTYDTPLDSGTIQGAYESGYWNYVLNPFNVGMNLSSAPSSPSTNATSPDVITGLGYLQWLGDTNSYPASSSVWMTNVYCLTIAQGPAVAFTIAGGETGAYYDVFATAGLTAALTNGTWVWCGQGLSCNTYAVPIASLGSANACLILGTPQDSDNDGLTDAYKLLVLHIGTNNPDANLDGILNGWEVLLGLNLQTNNVMTQHVTYGYSAADWLNTITGVKSGTIVTDPEGNVTQVSQ